MSEESQRRSFWSRLFSLDYHSGREGRVVEYIIHRLREGASLQEVVQEEYVRRNASPVEVDEICSNPRLVEAARERMERDFGSEELNPTRPPE
jgi:predicted deacylase